jgi:tetratricopeptide (TPR) repeat protein
VSEHAGTRAGRRRAAHQPGKRAAAKPGKPAGGPARRTVWPARSGTVPFTDRGFIPRPETGQGPWDTLRQGSTVIIGPASPAGPAGTGKSHLAAAFATRLWATGQLDLLVWVTAGSRDAIVTGYAQALAGIRVAAPPGQPEAAAARFLAWLAATGRRWLVVLDGLADPADADGLWPHGPSGQAVVTTGRPGVRPQPPGDHLAVGLPGFSQREALRYLADRLSDDHYQVAGSLDVAFVLGCLPAGLHLAAAYLRETGQDCRQYRLACERYRQQDGHPAGDLLAPAWMVAAGRAVQLAPAGQAWPALKLAAVLGPAGIPGTVLTAVAAAGYVTGLPRVTDADQVSVQAAYGNLEQLGLISIAPDDAVRTVLMPGALQESVRRAMGPAELRQAALVAADSVHATWPAADRAASTVAGSDAAALEQAYRDCAVSVLRSAGPALWQAGRPHPLLAQVGQSLDDARMAECAVRYWRLLAVRCGEHLGARSPVTLQFRERMARAAVAAGHADEAIALYKELVAGTDDAAGPGREQAITVRASLAQAYRAAGRLEDSISLAERVAAECERVFGPAQPQSTQSLHALGEAYAGAGRDQEAATVLRRCLAVRERTVGLMQPGTVAARQQLAGIYRRAGHADEAIGLYQETLTRVVKAAGPAYPDAVIAREHLAAAYDQAGRADDAAATLGRALSEWERVSGAGPGNTIAARASLAAIHCRDGRLRAAFPLYEGVLEDLYPISGPGHPDTLRARWNVAAVYHKARRVPDAIGMGETVLADCERFLGPGHWETLSTRANLAHAYHAAGLLKRASAQFDRALRDCEQALRPDDELTGAVRVLRKRYLAGRQGPAPILTSPAGWIRASRQGPETRTDDAWA